MPDARINSPRSNETNAQALRMKDKLGAVQLERVVDLLMIDSLQSEVCL
jgi:hypothetical protein